MKRAKTLLLSLLLALGCSSSPGEDAPPESAASDASGQAFADTAIDERGASGDAASSVDVDIVPDVSVTEAEADTSESDVAANDTGSPETDGVQGSDAGSAPVDTDAPADDTIESGPDTDEPGMPPLEGPPEEWAWFWIDGATCADGSPTGMGVNLKPGATRALVYLQGGGACWKFSNCAGLVKTSLYLDGFDEDDFFGFVGSAYTGSFLFDRDNPKNPFADAHLVILPYCTGDAFAGTKVTELEGAFGQKETMHFVGHNNIMAYLEHLVPTFAGVDQVVVSGSSAGGFGAALNWPFFVDAFASASVDLIDDSGPAIQPAGGRWEEWDAAWDIILPPGCMDCDGDVSAIVDYYAETLLQDHRMGFITYDADAVITTFFNMWAWDFTSAIYDLANRLDDVPNAQYFIRSGIAHTMLIGGIETSEAADGMPLWFWIDKLVGHDPDWSSHAP